MFLKRVCVECPAGAPESSVLQECPTRVSQKSGFTECFTGVFVSQKSHHDALWGLSSRCKFGFPVSIVFVCVVIPSPSRRETELAQSFTSNEFSYWSRQRQCQLDRHRFLTGAVTLFLCVNFLYHRSMIHVRTTVSLGWFHRSVRACVKHSVLPNGVTWCQGTDWEAFSLESGGNGRR